MKKLHLSIFYFLLSVFCLLPGTLSAQMTVRTQKVKGNGKLITQSIAISDFSKIDISSVTVEVNYSQALNPGSLEFTIDENLWEYFDIYTKDGVLYITLKSEYKEFNNGVHPNLIPKKSFLTVSSKWLDSISIGGRSTVNFCTAFTSEHLHIGIRGSGKIVANKYPVQIEKFSAGIRGSGNLQLAGNLQQADIQIRGSGRIQFAGAIQQAGIEIRGSGSVQLSGTIQQADIQISGSGSVKALDCEIKQLQVNVRGSGSLITSVSDTLTANVAGSGSVIFKGTPEITGTNVRGSGRIKKL